MKLENKIAIITGGARGIGKAISKHLAGKGAKVIVVNVNPSSRDAIVKECEEEGLSITTFLADVSHEEEVIRVVKSTIDQFGRIDILVNNAGITKDNLILRMKSKEWDAVIDTNLKGTFHCIKAVGRYMMKARYGKIINISSVVAKMGNAGQANYVASKAGVIGLTKSVAREFASRNINVNAIAPGYIRTDMTEALNDDTKNLFLDRIPLKKIGMPEDVANLVCFLASDQASYITGQVIHVDGGLVM